MRFDRPSPGEDFNEGEVTAPRQAATVILVRGGAERLEVLLVQRNPAARFMGGTWVFPGGAVDAADGEEDTAHRLAAVREVAEEAGVTLPDPDGLVPFSRWITPEAIRVRFDTHFFVAALPPEQEARPDGEECVAARWLTPSDALGEWRAGHLQLVFPTIKHLEQLSEYASADDVLARVHGRDVRPVTPRVVTGDGSARVILPGEPGYEDAGASGA